MAGYAEGRNAEACGREHDEKHGTEHGEVGEAAYPPDHRSS